MPIPLRQLQVNQPARVVALAGQGAISRRIRDMGIQQGGLVRVIDRAPLRDPVALKLEDFTVTLRNNEADHILVEPLEGNHEAR